VASTGTTTMKIITAGAALAAVLTFATPPATALAQSVIVKQGAIMCPSQGDLVVLSTSGQTPPDCQRLAHDTPGRIVDNAGHGIVAVRSGNSGKWWFLEGSLKHTK
jgi:hypothetical protein